MKSYVDIGLIVPLRQEFRRLEAIFKTKSEATDGTIFSKEFEIGGGLRLVAFLQDDMGKEAAIRTTEAMLAKYDLGIVAVVGIAGGISDDVSLGDVCFTGTTFDVLENAKVSDKRKGRPAKIEFHPKAHPTDPRLAFAFSYVELGSEIKGRFEQWQEDQYYEAQAQVSGQFIGRGGKQEAISIPAIHQGAIVCGAVSKSAIYNSDLQSIDRKVLAIETEAGGVFSSAERAEVPAICIRGICDYADENKSQLEADTNGRARDIAASNAVTFLRLQLQNPNFLRYLDGRRARFSTTGAPLLAELNHQAEAEALKSVKNDIHEHLNQLSPEYRGKPKGYRLPLPRVKKSPVMANVAPSPKQTEPIGLLEAAVAHRVTLVGVPLNYPENSLPWIIAAELSLVEVDGKQALPIVTNGENIRPPSARPWKYCRL